MLVQEHDDIFALFKLDSYRKLIEEDGMEQAIVTYLRLEWYNPLLGVYICFTNTEDLLAFLAKLYHPHNSVDEDNLRYYITMLSQHPRLWIEQYDARIYRWFQSCGFRRIRL